MATLCKLTGQALPYRCGDCRGFCIEQPGMTAAALTAWATPEATAERMRRVYARLQTDDEDECGCTEGETMPGPVAPKPPPCPATKRPVGMQLKPPSSPPVRPRPPQIPAISQNDTE